MGEEHGEYGRQKDHGRWKRFLVTNADANAAYAELQDRVRLRQAGRSDLERFKAKFRSESPHPGGCEHTAC
jgi:hypothetical protein